MAWYLSPKILRIKNQYENIFSVIDFLQGLFNRFSSLASHFLVSYSGCGIKR